MGHDLVKCNNRAEFVGQTTDRWGPPGVRCKLHTEAAPEESSSSEEEEPDPALVMSGLIPVDTAAQSDAGKVVKTL